MDISNRTLIRGDNLEVMRNLPDACVDLIATDPPFNSKRNYFIPYRDEQGKPPDVLIKAFEDTWAWGERAAMTYEELLSDVDGQIGDTIEGLQVFLNETPMMAYLVMMAIRLVEMKRILKDTGSLYLHCDPKASHYLKIILDAVFGSNSFRNEIVWCYKSGGAGKRDFAKKHHIIFRYSKTDNDVFNQSKQKSYVLPSGNKKVTYYKDEIGTYTLVNQRDWWDDIGMLSTAPGGERVTYPTQKPIELYKRIIAASSNKGDLVLDPFTGCGTTIIAAEQLDRQWVGIDLTYLAIGAVKLQIERLCPQIRNKISIIGTPENAQHALKLARDNKDGFEMWCIVHVLQFKANAEKGPDGGIDGTLKFPIGKVNGEQGFGKAVAQVKGGNFTLNDIRGFRTAMNNKKADLGIFVATKPPTRGMKTEIARAGFYQHPFNQEQYPKLQYFQIQEYFDGKLPKLPPREKIVL